MWNDLKWRAEGASLFSTQPAASWELSEYLRLHPPLGILSLSVIGHSIPSPCTPEFSTVPPLSVLLWIAFFYLGNPGADRRGMLLFHLEGQKASFHKALFFAKELSQTRCQDGSWGVVIM